MHTPDQTPGSHDITGSDPILLERWFEVLERRFQQLPQAARASLGVDARRRAERAVRLGGPWSLYRLRETLRCCLVQSEEQSQAFDLAFREAFPSSTEPARLLKLYSGQDLDQGFQRLNAPDERKTGGPLARLDPATAPRKPSARKRWSCLVAVIAVVGIFAVALRTHTVPKSTSTRTLPSASGSIAPSAAPQPSGSVTAEPLMDAPAENDPKSYFMGPLKPGAPIVKPLKDFPWAWFGAGLLAAGCAGIGLAFWQVRRRQLPEPEVRQLAPEASRSELVVEPPEEFTLTTAISPRALDQLADAVGLVLDPEAMPLPDMARTVQETVRRAGVPRIVWRPPSRVRRLLVLWDSSSRYLQEVPLHRQLYAGLRSRAIPVALAEYSGDFEWIRYADEAQPTSLARAAERESSSIVLVLGEPDELTQPKRALRVLTTFHQLAWLHPRERGTWGPAVHLASRALPVFATDEPGIRQLARWVAVARRGHGVLPRTTQWQGAWQQEHTAAVRRLSQREVRELESFLGPALPWAAALAACPAAVSRNYAEWVRIGLAKDPVFAAYRPTPQLLDRIFAIARTRGRGLVFDKNVRCHLWWQILAVRWPKLHRAVLELHVEALTKLADTNENGAELEREAAEVLLRWLLLTRTWPDVPRKRKSPELAEVAHRLRDLRRKGRLATWISEWMNGKDDHGAFVLPRRDPRQPLTTEARRYAQAAELDVDPPAWTLSTKLAMVASVAILCSGAGTLGYGKLRPSKVLVMPGFQNAGWVVTFDKVKFRVLDRGWSFPIDVPKGGNVSVAPNPTDADQPRCWDEATFYDALALRCANGEQPAYSSRVSVVFASGLRNGLRFRDDRDRLRVARWLLRSGSASLVLAPNNADTKDLWRWNDSLQKDVLSFALPDSTRLSWKIFNDHPQERVLAQARSWAALKLNDVTRDHQILPLPDATDPIVARLVASRDESVTFDSKIGATVFSVRSLPKVKLRLRCEEAKPCSWSGWFEDELDAQGAERPADVKGEGEQVWYLAKGPWHFRGPIQEQSVDTTKLTDGQEIVFRGQAAPLPKATQVRTVAIDSCHQSLDCTIYGVCTRRNGRCLPATDADCAKSTWCTENGQCTAKDGYYCIAETNADCAKSQLCTYYGQCTAKNRYCVAATDADCAKSKRCAVYGRCTAKDGHCIVASDADCAKSTYCTDNGLQTAKDGICVAVTDADCAKSKECTVSGRCSAKDGNCVVATDADCAVKSQVCTVDGLCTAKNGYCIVATGADCAKSRGCTEGGRCTAMHGICIATTDADCAKSKECTVSGRCSAKDGECIAATDADCPKSTYCADYGRCTARDGECVVATGADCAKSTYCTSFRRCTAKDGECVDGP